MTRGVPFQKGRPKSGGRKSGTPNRRTTAAAEVLEDLKCDPIEALVRIAQAKTTPLEIQVACYKELGQYRYAKRRALEVTGHEGEPVRIEVVYV